MSDQPPYEPHDHPHHHPDELQIAVVDRNDGAFHGPH